LKEWPQQQLPEEVTLALFIDFVDADGDGFITASDVFTANSLISNRHEVFLRVLFGMYLESLPNSRPEKPTDSVLSTLITNPVLRDHIAKGDLKLNHFDSSQGASFDNVCYINIEDDPLVGKFITEDHVAYMFEKYGFPAANGRKVFETLLGMLDVLGLEVSKYEPKRDAEEEESTNGEESSVKVISPQRKRLYLDQFIELMNLDDVLVLVILVRARYHLTQLVDLIESAIEQHKAAGGNNVEVNDTEREDDGDDFNIVSQSAEISTEVFMKEFAETI